jgi:hypothetical protein
VDAETARRGDVPFVFAAYGFGAASFDPPPWAFVAAAPSDLPWAIDAALRSASRPLA